jgi:hypothetical protein
VLLKKRNPGKNVEKKSNQTKNRYRENGGYRQGLAERFTIQRAEKTMIMHRQLLIL